MHSFNMHEFSRGGKIEGNYVDKILNEIRTLDHDAKNMLSRCIICYERRNMEQDLRQPSLEFLTLCLNVLLFKLGGQVKITAEEIHSNIDVYIGTRIQIDQDEHTTLLTLMTRDHWQRMYGRGLNDVL